MVGASDVMATRLEVADGMFTGGVDVYAYGRGNADHVTAMCPPSAAPGTAPS